MAEMSLDAVNFQSLSIVREELVATVEDSARFLEKFVTSQEDGESLQACVNGISQIEGIMRLIEFDGAQLLAEELLANANEISPGNSGRLYEKRLEVVSNSFFVITRYLEFVQQTERKAPVLLIPQINELRKLRDKSTLPECHFFNLNVQGDPKIPNVEQLNLAGQPINTVVRRLRHMFQIGLLGLIRENQHHNSIALMRRALNRLMRLSGSKPISTLWWLSSVCLEAMLAKDMAILETRKLLFGRVDRIIRQVQNSPENAFESAPPAGLLKELIYLIALSDFDSHEAKSIIKSYGVQSFGLKEADLANQREALNGPSAHTVSSLKNVLQVELANTKKVLENASQSSVQKIDDLDGFAGALQKIAEILAIVGFAAPSKTLKEELSRIEKWRDANTEISLDELDEAANTLLYVESSIANIELNQLSNEELDQANKVAQREIIASGELAEAKRIVISEALAGLSLTKRALSSFSESNFDTGHIRNIIKTLDSIRGGMVMLKNQRAVNVLTRCTEFVNDVLLAKDHPPALKELLETFADAVIAVEYYLNSATAMLVLDDSVLQLAEESLDALGYSVIEEG